jgi:sodium/proline symporter
VSAYFWYKGGTKGENYMSISQIGMLIAMIVYLVGMIYIGFQVADRNKTVGDFYLGGRKLGPLVTAMSAEASDMSSYLLMGIPGLAYLSGMAEVSWTIIGLAAGTYLNWLIVAKRLRRYSEVNESITIPEFFTNRYGDKKHVLMLVAAIWIIVFFVPYTASGFAACGKLFRSLFNVDYHVAMIVSAIVIIAYTTLGGFLAASTTDFIQSIIMSVALICILVFGIMTAGGMDAVLRNASSLPGYFSLTHTHVTGGSKPYSLLSIISTLAWGMGYFGMPHILLRFMAIEDDAKLKISRRVASIWALVAMFISVLIGMVGLACSANGSLKTLAGSASETIIVEMSKLLASHGVLFAVIAGIVLSGILASTMSTSDSQLLAASSSVSNDILTGFFHKKMSQKTLLLISRVSLVVIALIGIVLAWNPNSSVFRIVSFAWAGFGAAFGPVVLLALYWRRSNKYGALFGMITGGAMVFIWKYLVRPLGGHFDIYELLPAFLLALIVNVIVSLLTKAPDDEILADYDRVKAMK